MSDWPWGYSFSFSNCSRIDWLSSSWFSDVASPMDWTNSCWCSPSEIVVEQSDSDKAFFKFCADLGVSPHRPMDPMAPLAMKLAEELLAMRFVCAMVEDRGVQVTTAAKYFSAYQGWHLREHGIKLAGGLKLERLPQMLKGLRRIKGDKPKRVRTPISPKALRAAMDKLLPKTVPWCANLRAAIAAAFQGLMRSEEYLAKDHNMIRAAGRPTSTASTSAPASSSAARGRRAPARRTSPPSPPSSTRWRTTRWGRSSPHVAEASLPTASGSSPSVTEACVPPPD